MKALGYALIIVCVCTAVRAAVIVSETDGTDWTVSGVLGGAFGAESGTGTRGGTGYDVTGPQTQGDGGPFDDIVAESDELLDGGASFDFVAAEAYAIEFDFYNDGGGSYAPDYINAYFTDGTYHWVYSLTPTTSASHPYTAFLGFTQGSGWSELYGASTDEADFLGTLDGVTAMGVNFGYGSGVTGTQTYGIAGYTVNDSEGYNVPEPGSFIVLSTALMSLGFTYARRKKEQKA